MMLNRAYKSVQVGSRIIINHSNLQLGMQISGLFSKPMVKRILSRQLWVAGVRVFSSPKRQNRTRIKNTDMVVSYTLVIKHIQNERLPQKESFCNHLYYIAAQTSNENQQVTKKALQIAARGFCRTY